MITLSKLRDLNISGTATGRPEYVYSASGLVELGGEFYLVADDELHLAVFPADPARPGRWIPIFPGTLSLDYKQRKKEKADLEAITFLPPYKFAEQGALLLVPSLSRPNRVRGALLLVNETGLAEAVPIDFAKLHAALAAQIEELNVEGIAVTEDNLKLFHRGSKGNSRSAVIELHYANFLSDLHDSHTISEKNIISIRQYDLGQLKGITLAFTDATTLPDDRVVFLAAAEASKNAYDDGKYVGSSIGLMNRAGDVVHLEPIEGSFKFEGLTARLGKADEITLRLVTDTDDQTQPSSLFSASWTIVSVAR